MTTSAYYTINERIKIIKDLERFLKENNIRQVEFYNRSGAIFPGAVSGYLKGRNLPETKSLNIIKSTMENWDFDVEPSKKNNIGVSLNDIYKKIESLESQITDLSYKLTKNNNI
jgi:predicted transcriptional regulator